MATDTAAPAAAPSAGSIPFTIASRPQARYSNVQTVNNFASGGSFQVVQLPATGWVRKVSLLFTATGTWSSAAAIVTGDGPFNIITGITITDATGQPIQQPISGYNLYLVNKLLPAGVENTNIHRIGANPQMGPEYAFAASGTSGSAVFRLDIDFEQDVNTGYGCIPNLDSNASLQLRVDYAIGSTIFAPSNLTASTLTMRVDQHYWAPVGSTLGGVPVDVAPPGAGDYVETRYETQTVSAAAENLVTMTNRGGLIKGVIFVSRAAGVRTAMQAGANFGMLLDNQPIYEGIQIEAVYDEWRRASGMLGADLTTTYAPLTAGVLPGLDRGVTPFLFNDLGGRRDTWLATRVGSLFQSRLTPGASATTLEIITQLAQVKDTAAFYSRD